MATKYGKCTNIGNCDNADKKKVFEILDGQDFRCPECDNDLYSTKSDPAPNPKFPTLLKIGIPIILLGGIFFLLMGWLGGSKENKDICNNLPYVAQKDTTLSCGGVTYVLNNGDSLVFINDKVKLVRYASLKPQQSTTSKEQNRNDDFYVIKRRGQVKIGVQSDAAPLNYIENGRRKGLDYDLAKLIFSQTEFGLTNNTSIDADHQVEDYEEIPKMLSTKNSLGEYEVDIVMGGLTFNDGDNPNVIYTIPYMDNFGYCLVSKRNDDITFLKDLRNKKIGVVKGDPDVLSYAKSILPPGAKIVELSDDSETWMSDFINMQKIDAIIYDFPFASVEVRDSNLQIKVSNLPNSDISYKIGLRKGNERLRDELNTAIRKIKDLAQYSNLLKRYLPTDDVLIPRNVGNYPTHVVRTGETLSIIALDHLKDLNRWEEIQDLNNLPNPHFISKGKILIMPSDYR
jgi:ABC-type amino acid transport substrate-binding protein